MSEQIKFTISPDGMTTTHVTAILHDLLEDYRYFEYETSVIDPEKDPLLNMRMARASILAYFCYFDGVLNRWITAIDPEFDLDASTGAKLGRIRREIRYDRPLDYLDLRRSKGVRNKINHLQTSHDNMNNTKELLRGRFSRDIQELQNWLKIAGLRLGQKTHNDPEELVRPYLDVLSSQGVRSNHELSEEDEELVRLAELTFLELDAREAADGTS